MKTTTCIILSFLILVSLSSNSGCDHDPIELIDIPESSNGLVPVYDNNELWKTIEFLPGQNVQTPNTRITFRGFYFILGPNSGINVVAANIGLQNSIAFISIPKLHTMELLDDTLFAGNFRDRLAFSINDPYDISLISRETDFYPDAPPLSLPFGYEGFFECPDYNNGVILKWERTSIDNPMCWR